jgi:hypothetical protein
VKIGSPEIIRCKDLQAIGCMIYKPLSLLICLSNSCTAAIRPTYLTAHLSRHHPRRKQAATLVVDKYLNDLHKDNFFLDWDPDTAPVPGIPYSEALQCAYPGCNYVLASKQKMGHHVAQHKKNTPLVQMPCPLKCYAQSIFLSRGQWYKVKPSDDVAAQTDLPDFILSAVKELANAMPKRDHEPKALPPFLVRYAWHNIVADTPLSCIATLIPPIDGQDPFLAEVQRYYAEIIQVIKTPTQTTTNLTLLRRILSVG